MAEGHHGLSHHGDRPEQLEKLARLNTYQTELFAGFLEKLRGTPEGDGNLLDHSLFLYGASLSNPNLHAHYELPLTLVGGAAGRLAGDRHLVFPAETPMTNLLLAMLDNLDVEVDAIGDSTEPLDLELLQRLGGLHVLRCAPLAVTLLLGCAAVHAGPLLDAVKAGDTRGRASGSPSGPMRTTPTPTARRRCTGLCIRTISSSRACSSMRARVLPRQIVTVCRRSTWQPRTVARRWCARCSSMAPTRIPGCPRARRRS